MNPNQLAAFKILEQAQQALKAGNKDSARQFAAQAAQLAPELEEVWLLMAALAAPRDSVGYLEKALLINPNSERAKKGMAWAQGRLPAVPPAKVETPRPLVEQQAEAPAVKAKAVVVPLPVAVTSGEPSGVDETAPHAVTVPAALEETLPAANVLEENAPQAATSAEEPAAPTLVTPVQDRAGMVRTRFSWITLLVVLICLGLAWFAWRGTTPVAAMFDNIFTTREHGPAWAEASISKSNVSPAAPGVPGATTEPTATLEPTATPELVSPTPEDQLKTGGIPGPTAVILPSDTPLPTVVVLPTDTSLPAATPLPTATSLPPEVVLPTATQEIASAEQPSPTPLPTDTAAPQATQFVPPTRNPVPGGQTAGGEHWIDVDLTNQMVYAYEGNTVVNSFLVSTGTWEHPTVTGQYRVYIKLRYKDMSGPGYYLPNVPYTMFFYEGYAIHGTYWHNNFGTPMSHGCVNLSIPDSEWVYNFSSVGTLVNVHY
ncbi:MAG TPA: L,D-transpeptidase family protein [Anaerolineales bacterium]|jgi:lipoprotein-anchoring transpeptidase ErfK/SrfK